MKLPSQLAPLNSLFSSVLFLGVLFLGPAGCRQQPPHEEVSETLVVTQPPWFEDVTKEWGLDFIHDPGPIDGEYFLPQITGSGAALFDFDNDGRLDIYLLQFGGPGSGANNALFRQLPSGKFQNVSEGSGLDVDGHNTGVAVGDVDNNGWLDVVVTQYLGVKLYLNQGEGKFHDATEETGLQEAYWGASASFFDYDRDGWLDLVIANYVAFEESRRCTLRAGKRDYCRPNVFEGMPSLLFHNRGLNESNQWQGFEDRTDAAGIGKKKGPGMGVLCLDFSGDGWPDILITNDMQANHLWINQKNGVFTEEAVSRGIAHNSRGNALSNMGVACGDVDEDGLLDVFVTLFTNERNGLWKQGPRGMFREQTIASGLTRAKWHGTGWGTTFADFDQDGALDLALVNGFVDRQDVPAKSHWSAYMDRNQVFANDGAGQFRDISPDNSAFCGEPNIGRGLCVGDIDGDGALDLLVTQVAGPARILRNVAGQRGHWLMVRAVDPAHRRDAIGAEVRLQAGSRNWLSVIQPGQSFQCSNDPRAHFGLGSVERVESIEVHWPSGDLERFPCPGLDQVIEVHRGNGQAVETKLETPP